MSFEVPEHVRPIRARVKRFIEERIYPVEQSLVWGIERILFDADLGTTLGEERTWGTINGRTPAGPCTFARLGTDDVAGRIRAYVGEGRFTDDPLGTFGCRAVVEVPRLQELLRHICRQGFEHHAAVNGAGVAAVLEEAFSRYLGWDCFRHPGGNA